MESRAPMKKLLVMALVLLLAPAARAEDDETAPETSKDEAAVDLSSLRGLTGMREMIDARTPSGLWHIRAGAYGQYSTEEIELNPDVRTSQRDRYELTPYVGASFLGHLEAGINCPFPAVEHTKNEVH